MSGSRIGRAALLVAGGVLISRVLGFLRDVVLASRLGDTPIGDTYDAAFVIPDILNYLLAGGFLAITFIPIYTRYLANEDDQGGWDAFSSVFRPLAILVVALTALMALLTGPFVDLAFGSNMDEAQLAEIIRLTRLVLPAQVFFVLGAMFTAVQYAHGRFLIPTLAPIIYNLGIIVGGLATGAEPSATGFIVGAVVGAFVGNFALQWYGAHQTGLRMPKVKTGWSNPIFREYLTLAFPLMIGQSIVVLDESFARIFPAALEDGAVFAFNRARRLNMLPVGVIAQAAGVAAYPFFARMVAEGKREALAATMGKTLRMVLFTGGLATAIVMATALPTVRVAFQRGAFTSEGSDLAAGALTFLALSIPAWAAHQIFGRGFYANRQMWIPVIAGTIWSVAALPLYLTGNELWGVSGLGLASSLSITGYAVTLAVLWVRHHGDFGLEGVTGAAGRALGAALGSAAIGYLLAQAITGGADPTFVRALIGLVVGAAASAIAYLAVSRMLGSTEAAEMVGSRLKRRA
jgi:putative peptidoglycan lipid II flippase